MPTVLNQPVNTFDLYINRKDTKKVLGCIEILSREYGYKTVYSDFTVRRYSGRPMNYILK